MMKWVLWSDLHLELEWPMKARYLEVRREILRPADREGFLGDTFEGYKYRLPIIFDQHRDLVQIWKDNLIIVGNHERLQMQLLYTAFRDVRYEAVINGVRLLHGDRFDKVQDTNLERWFAKEALQFYIAHPGNPLLDYVYEKVMTEHRTNTPLLSGMEKVGILRAIFGHSHRQIAWWDEREGIAYFNPGAMKNKLTAVIFYPESGKIHLKDF